MEAKEFFYGSLFKVLLKVNDREYWILAYLHEPTA